MHVLGPDALEWMGSVYRILLGKAETGGSAAVFESVTRAGDGPPRHRHGNADESFVILSGDVEFWLEGERTICGPGQAIHVPRGCEHGFRVCDTAPARMLTVLTPGGFEDFFREMAAGGYELPRDMAAVRPIAERYALDFTGTPLDGPGR